MTTRARLPVLEEFIESEDRCRLFLRSWRPDRVRAVVVAVHGRGSVGERHASLAARLVARGIAAYAVDLRGCGHSPGARQRSASIDDRLLDIRAMLSHAMKRDPARPLFILGHGTGAMLACHYALRHPGEVDGLVCEAILPDLPWKAAIARRFSGLFRAFRRWGAPLPRPGTPLAGITLPLLLLHGSQDGSAPPSGSEYLHGCVASTDKTLLVFEGYDHDLIDGPGHALVQDRICQWIQAQLDSGTGRRRIGIEYIND